jgi:hypothetical protein
MWFLRQIHATHQVRQTGESMNENPLAFGEFPSIPRLTREMVVTEKLDGTNAQVAIFLRDEVPRSELDNPTTPFMSVSDGGMHYVMLAGSRSRWLSALADNFGFARWVSENRDALLALGPGRHFGEWWGQGIQRGYGLTEKRFSLFNTKRWTSNYNSDSSATVSEADATRCLEVPCCHVTPLLAIGPFQTDTVDTVLHALATFGSRAAPGFMKPEGVVVYHVAGNYMFKKTLDKNDGHKGAR